MKEKEFTVNKSEEGKNSLEDEDENENEEIEKRDSE